MSEYFSDAIDVESSHESDSVANAMAEGYDIVEYYEKADSSGDGQLVLFRDDLLFERSRLQAILRQLLNDDIDSDGDDACTEPGACRSCEGSLLCDCVCVSQER